MNPLIEAYQTAVTDHTQRMGAPVALVVPAQGVKSLADSLAESTKIGEIYAKGNRDGTFDVFVSNVLRAKNLTLKKVNHRFGLNPDYIPALPNWKIDPKTGTTESGDDDGAKLLRDALSNLKSRDYTSALPNWKRSTDAHNGVAKNSDKMLLNQS